MNKHTPQDETTLGEDTPRNVLGTMLQPCSHDPLTGFLRDGCCMIHENDPGRHLVCGIMTSEFLEFSLRKGNDLITPRPEYNFPGLKPGDRWCLCVSRWYEAYKAGCAPRVVLEATHEDVLTDVSADILNAFSRHHEES